MKVMITGSYDPLTLGHLDIIKRAASLFDEVVIAILVNENKITTFSHQERLHMIHESLVELNLANCSVVHDSGLAVDCAQRLGCTALIRGVRSSVDYDYEVNQASINRMLNGTIETLFFAASPLYATVSSSMVKAVAQYGGPLDPFVPVHVEKALREKFPTPLKGTRI